MCHIVESWKSEKWWERKERRTEEELANKPSNETKGNAYLYKSISSNQNLGKTRLEWKTKEREINVDVITQMDYKTLFMITLVCFQTNIKENPIQRYAETFAIITRLNRLLTLEFAEGIYVNGCLRENLHTDVQHNYLDSSCWTQLF